jgi:uncharacterized protein YjiS (DUF1127 family)
MADAHIDLAGFDQSGLKARVQKFRDMLDERAARRDAYRRTVRELHACSDRDLGIHRRDITRIASQAADQV